MKIISTNIAQPQTIKWRGKDVKTGIFKKPVDQPLVLEMEDVAGDSVVDRRYHGGVDKALYAYSTDHYPFWKKNYPDLDWEYGMFGENLSIEGLNEHEVHIGDTYEVGNAQIQVSQPRQPCFKLGVKFGTQAILKQFVNLPYCGAYFRVLKEGEVKTGDTFTLIDRPSGSMPLAQVFFLLYHKEQDKKLLRLAANNPYLSQVVRDEFQAKLDKIFDQP